MKSIVFIVRSSCDNQEQAESSYMPPLGVLSIANTLRMHGYHVHVLDLVHVIMKLVKFMN